jgi:hypothetical protein
MHVGKTAISDMYQQIGGFVLRGISRVYAGLFRFMLLFHAIKPHDNNMK